MEESHKTAIPIFCSNCGSILPPLQMTGGVTCYDCGITLTVEAWMNKEEEYFVNFKPLKTKPAQQKDSQSTAAAGPVVVRVCPKCGNDSMSYAALQLRSADEGQTVFFTCTKCGFKEAENS